MLKETDFLNTKFVSYCRKSSEQDERQALSIESQLEEVKKIANDYGVNINIEDGRQEAKSAKDPGKRLEFERLLRDIEKVKVQGIVTWHADRLSRNAIDSARLIDLMDKGKLKFVITRSTIYYASDPMSKFMLHLATGQAKMDNDNKGINVMRGLIKKRKMGHLPGIAKVGYMNDNGEKGYRKIQPDPDRFYLVQQIFQMYLTEKYTAGQLYEIVIDRIGLTTFPRKRMGGKLIKKSQFYRMLKDPWYAGFFFGKNDEGDIVRYEMDSEVQRVITEKDHRKIISMLCRSGNRRAWVYRDEFPYKKFCMCGHCGGSVTAEQKLQMICSRCKYKFSSSNKIHCPKCKHDVKDRRNKLLKYVYYHCCHKKDPNCPGGSVSENDIKNVLKIEVVDKLAISDALKQWCLNSIVEL